MAIGTLLSCCWILTSQSHELVKNLLLSKTYSTTIKQLPRPHHLGQYGLHMPAPFPSIFVITNEVGALNTLINNAFFLVIPFEIPLKLIFISFIIDIDIIILAVLDCPINGFALQSLVLCYSLDGLVLVIEAIIILVYFNYILYSAIYYAFNYFVFVG